MLTSCHFCRRPGNNSLLKGNIATSHYRTSWSGLSGLLRKLKAMASLGQWAGLHGVCQTHLPMESSLRKELIFRDQATFRGGGCPFFIEPVLGFDSIWFNMILLPFILLWKQRCSVLSHLTDEKAKGLFSFSKTPCCKLLGDKGCLYVVRATSSM